MLIKQGAPKRAMSPFLFFSNEKRAQIQTEYPNMKITEVSAKLGEIWRDMTDEEKAPYVEENNELDKIQYTCCCIVTCLITMEYAYF